MSNEFLRKIIKKVSQNLFSDLRGGGQRSRPLPLPPLTINDPTAPYLPLPLSEQRALCARAKFSYFPFPRFLFTLVSSLSLLSHLLPLLPPPLPPYLLPFPPPHLRDEVGNVKRIMPDEGRRRTDDR